MNVSPDPAAACSWASSACRTSHALFASVMRKIQALGGKQHKVVLLNSPWLEHLPRHQPLWSLLDDMTHELVDRLDCHVDMHVMVMLHVPHDETFEQMVCCGNAYWNGTSLADVAAAQSIIAQHLRSAAAGTVSHPFPCVTYTIQCPPFFEENEVVAQAITRDVVNLVARLEAQVAEPA